MCPYFGLGAYVRDARLTDVERETIQDHKVQDTHLGKTVLNVKKQDMFNMGTNQQERKNELEEVDRAKSF
jgi:hypothetical protein